jgi:hypothetical protein
LGKNYSSNPNWYRKDQVLKIYLLYLIIIWWVSRHRTEIVVKSCSQCHILFITSRCNQHRNDICCPFGCREVRKKLKSNKRSIKYYQDPSGKKKKQVINQKRKINESHEPNHSISINKIIIFFLHKILTLLWSVPLTLNSIENIYNAVDAKMRQHSLYKNSS